MTNPADDRDFRPRVTQLKQTKSDDLADASGKPENDEPKPVREIRVLTKSFQADEKDFRPMPVNPKTFVGDEPDPKDSSALEPVASSTSETTRVAPSSALAKQIASAGKVSTPPKEPESGTPTSSPAPNLGKSEPPVGE